MTWRLWLLSAVAVLWAASPAFACKCAFVPRDRAIIATPLVFEGRVLKIETTRETGDAMQVTTLMVVKNVKGMSAGEVGSSRVDLQACKLEYSIVSPK